MTEDFDLRNEAEQPSDGELDRVLRPARFDDFTGQRAALENLGVFVQAAANRGEALDHTLLHGPPGLGKTTLAHILAREMGVNLRQTSGPVLEKAGDLAIGVAEKFIREKISSEDKTRLVRESVASLSTSPSAN